MTQLLVSVRDATEAEIALNCGVDVIDVKEPARGSLGAPDRHIVQDVLKRIAGRVPVSIALGELISIDPPSRPISGLAFAKFGLAGCASEKNWEARWQRAVGELPAGVAPVAVAYADWQTVDAPSPQHVLHRGAALGCKVLLIDTCSKSSGTLLDHVSRAKLGSLTRAAHDVGLQCALAGSLTIPQIGQLLSLEPDYVAVRKAACAGGRTGSLDRARVRRLSSLVRQGYEMPRMAQLD
jgi:(5-formylfuran-3-yl)methyl phosphate synthase